MPSLEVARHCFSLRWGSKPRRLAAASALRKLASASAVPALSRALRDPEAEVRKRVVTALMYIGDDRVLESLLFASEDPDGEVRHSAVAALHAYRGPHVLSALRERLRDPERAIRYEAVRVLGLHGAAISDPRALEVMEEAADRGDLEWVARFFAMLQESGDPSAEARLVAWLRHSGSEVRRAAAKALDDGGWEGEEEPDCVAYAIACGDYAKAARYGEAAVDALAEALANWNCGDRRSARGEKESRLRKKEELATLTNALASLQPLPEGALAKLRSATATASELGKQGRDEAIARLLGESPRLEAGVPGAGQETGKARDESRCGPAPASSASVETSARGRDDADGPTPADDGQDEPALADASQDSTPHAANGGFDANAFDVGSRPRSPSADDGLELDQVEAELLDWVRVEIDEEGAVVVEIDDEPVTAVARGVEAVARGVESASPDQPAEVSVERTPGPPAGLIEEFAAFEDVPPPLGRDEGVETELPADDRGADAAPALDPDPASQADVVLSPRLIESAPDAEPPPPALDSVANDASQRAERVFEAFANGASEPEPSLEVDDAAVVPQDATEEPADDSRAFGERRALADEHDPVDQDPVVRSPQLASAPDSPRPVPPSPWKEAEARPRSFGEPEPMTLREAAARRERRLARTPLAWRELTIMASSEDVRMRLAVVDRLRVVSGERATRRIARMLSDRDVQVRALALTVLCKRRAAGWERYVAGVLYDEYPQMRSAAVRTLAVWRTSQALAALADYLSSPDGSPETASEAAAKLAPFVPPSVPADRPDARSGTDRGGTFATDPVDVAALDLEALVRLRETGDADAARRAREEIDERIAGLRRRLASAQRTLSGERDDERTFSFACRCGRTYRLGSRHLGRRVKCVCGARNVIASVDERF